MAPDTKVPDGRTAGRTDNAKTISLRLWRGIIIHETQLTLINWQPLCEYVFCHCGGGGGGDGFMIPGRGYNLGLRFFEELRQTLGIGDPGLTVKVIHYKNVLETIAFKDHFKMHKVESRASYNIYVVAALNT
ncbi:hypothetical protein DPMN_114287 [Dreissena polymorpha]|uniref:Uncharacterized protein n=1 Tax=Dreissena polymorpha TaxID=45954 RepID=A0A9D4KJL4_DREPO|nr:hypothetical protein DPMN_114287 [Dreissena polymorpha]